MKENRNCSQKIKNNNCFYNNRKNNNNKYQIIMDKNKNKIDYY